MKLKKALLHRVSLVIIGLGIILNGYSQTLPTNGLVAYYPFIGNANDLVNGDNGQVLGASLTTDRFGNPNNAYYFNVTNSGAIACSGKNLPLGSSPRTISIWVKPDDIPIGTSFVPMNFLGYGTFNGTNGGIYLQFVYQNIHGVVTPVLGIDETEWNVWFQTWNYSEWHHFVWILDQNAKATFYLDGKAQALTTLPPPDTKISTVAGPLYLGYGAGRYFDGALDDIRIYNRALSPVEVSQLYAIESVPSQSAFTNGLVAYFPFNGNANDASLNQDNGKVLGAIPTQDRFGNPNSAFYFNVTNTSAIVCSGTNLPLGSNPRTFSVWIKPDFLGKNSDYRGDTFGYGQINGNEGSFFGHSIWDATPHLMTFGVSSDLLQWTKDVSNWDFTKWHHLVMGVTDGTHAFLYLDGKQLTFQSFPPPGLGLNTTRGPLYIGYFAGTYFNGSIDDFRAYDRALSSAEIQQLYILESTPPPAPSIALIKAVKPTLSSLLVGTSYQLQLSGDMNTWTNQGTAFTATSTNMVYPGYFDVEDWNKLFFRVKSTP